MSIFLKNIFFVFEAEYCTRIFNIYKIYLTAPSSYAVQHNLMSSIACSSGKVEGQDHSRGLALIKRRWLVKKSPRRAFLLPIASCSPIDPLLDHYPPFCSGHREEREKTCNNVKRLNKIPDPWRMKENHVSGIKWHGFEGESTRGHRQFCKRGFSVEQHIVHETALVCYFDIKQNELSAGVSAPVHQQQNFCAKSQDVGQTLMETCNGLFIL